MKRPVTRVVETAGLQPRGGFVPPKDMIVTDLVDDDDFLMTVTTLGEYADVSPTTVGMVVDYLLRADLALYKGTDVTEAVFNAFIISMMGAKMVNKIDDAIDLEKQISEELIKGKDRNYKKVVTCACRLVVFDAVIRAMYYDENTKPPKPTLEDAQYITYLEVSALRHFKEFEKPVTKIGFSVSGEGSKNVSASDGDYLTEDSIIDLKTSKSKPTSKDTLQVLMYYLMGLHEDYETFSKIQYLKIVNPKLGKVYTYDLDDLTDETKLQVERDVIGYDVD